MYDVTMTVYADSILSREAGRYNVERVEDAIRFFGSFETTDFPMFRESLLNSNATEVWANLRITEQGTGRIVMTSLL